MYVDKTLSSNVAMLYATETKHSEFHDKLHTFDEDSYQFVVDTGTTFHIYKDRDLFTSPIIKATHIFIKDVGGQIKVRGHSTIKIQVVENMNENCNLIITYILYPPKNPTNLISLQLWSELTHNPPCTCKIMISGTTLFFWDNNNHTKTITHHLHLKLLIFHATRGRTHYHIKVHC